MNIEKVKNYNQKVLAVISTLGVIFLIICIVMLIAELFPRRYYNDHQPQGLISDERIEELNQENLRKQIISYESPWLIDTVKSVYVVPVSIKTLKKAEEVAEETTLGSAQLDLFGSSKMKRGYYGRRHFEGKYANLIIYSPVEEKTTSLFNERIFIGDVTSYYFKDDILLVFYSASKDTDKNGVIDLSDLRNLCVYSLNTGIMRKISDQGNQVEGYMFVENSKDLLVEFKLSQYKENQFGNNQSPGKIMKYSFDSQELSDIIPEKIQSDMQKLIEGK